MKKMQQIGLHVFNPEWSGYHSSSFTECTMKIYGTNEQMTIPCQTCTKVMDVKKALAAATMVEPGDLAFVVKQGCTWRIQHDHSEVGRNVTVKGIKSFQPLPHKYEHPVIFIGTGYNGIKNALLYAHEGNRDFIMFDRYDRVGGHAWLTQANKTSKLQTEMASFHVWFGPEWGENEKLGYPVDWHTWPKKDEIIQHCQHACEKYGMIEHCRFRVEVTSMDIVGKISDFDRQYVLLVEPKDKDEAYQVRASSFYHFPGAYFTKRIIDYPGESEFTGQIGYGMNDDIPFDHLWHSRTAIVGNGAFAVENIRTCCEYGTAKIFLITRRKNLPSPRLSCWFVHQGIVPTPAGMLLNTFKPMFEACGFGDPWTYHSVYASKDKKHCNIISNSRFGIGDVTFLAVATGRCEYVQDLIKRFTQRTIHLQGGQKLDQIDNVIKALGLIADHTCDKFHKIKELIGPWPNGDIRRIIYADPLGMNAANFTTFSTGIGSYTTGIRDKYLIDFPAEQRLVLEHCTPLLPRSKASGEKPAHQYDAKYATTCAVVIEGVCPKITMKCAPVSDYMHTLYWTVNPLDRFLEECVQSWDAYQKDWKAQGFDHPYIPYPYTKEIVHGWFSEFAATVGPVSLEAKQNWMKEQEALALQAQQDQGPVSLDTAEGKDFWRQHCERGHETFRKGSKIAFGNAA